MTSTTTDDLRQLDTQVAEQVFGIQKIFQPYTVKSASSSLYFGNPFDLVYIPSGKPPRTHMIDAVAVPSYSTDIAAAMQVVEKMRECYPQIWFTCGFAGDDKWMAGFEWANTSDGSVSVIAESLPQAICEAALQVTKEQSK